MLALLSISPSKGERMKYNNRAILSVFVSVILTACSDIGSRDNPFDIHGSEYEDYWGHSCEYDPSYCNDDVPASYAEEADINQNLGQPVSSSSYREFVIVGAPSSSASREPFNIVDKPTSSATIIDNPDTPTLSSSSVEIVTDLGSCMPLTSPIDKGTATSWKFFPNASGRYNVIEFVRATYVWDFDGLTANGPGSTLTSGEVTYANPGIFSASVTVTMSDGSSEVIVCDELQVLDEQSSSSSLEIVESSSSSKIEDTPVSSDSWACGEALVRDEVSYETVVINERCWTKENMDYVPSTGNTMCYGGESTNCEIYGRLYDYEAASLACPSGWRLPTSDEFVELQEYSGEDMYDAGAWFKAANGWTGENGNDELGFSALPGGRCDYAQTCNGLGERGYWWTSTEVVKNASHYTMFLNGDCSTFYATTKMDNSDYASVRCVKIE